MHIVLDHAALLLVDVQRDALHPDGTLGRAGQAPNAAEVSRLVDAWGRLVDLMREAGRPVVWVKTSLRPDFADSTHAPLWLERQRAEVGPFFIEGSWGAEVMDGLDAAPDDYVVVKKGHSAYDNTHLDRLLTNLGVSQCIVVGGGVTDTIAETARTGGRLGYEQFVVQDALYPPDAAELHAPRKQAEVIALEDVYPPPLPPRRSPRGRGPEYAMVLVDMQNDFMNAERPHVLYGLSDPMPEEKRREHRREHATKLSAAMRERGWPVIYVRVVRRQDNSDDVHSRTHRRARTLPPGVTHCAYGTWGAEMVDELHPEEGRLRGREEGRQRLRLHAAAPHPAEPERAAPADDRRRGDRMRMGDGARRRHARLRHHRHRRRHLPARLARPRFAGRVVHRPPDR